MFLGWKEDPNGCPIQTVIFTNSLDFSFKTFLQIGLLVFWGLCWNGLFFLWWNCWTVHRCSMYFGYSTSRWWTSGRKQKPSLWMRMPWSASYPWVSLYLHLWWNSLLKGCKIPRCYLARLVLTPLFDTWCSCWGLTLVLEVIDEDTPSVFRGWLRRQSSPRPMVERQGTEFDWNWSCLWVLFI